MASNDDLSVGPQQQGQGSTGATNLSNADDIFQQELQNMNKATLNGLDISKYTRRQRYLIDQERCRRSTARKLAAATSKQPGPSAKLLPPSAGVSSRPDSPGPKVISDDPVPIPGPNSPDDTPPRPTTEPPKSWYLFPEHHDLVVQQVPGVRFKNSNVDGFYEWPTNILGTFRCSKKKCKNEWESGVVSTVIRKYLLPGDRLAYNAKVFNQRCMRCKSLGYMTIEQGVYIERIVRRLKIWRNETVEVLPGYFKETQPHKSSLCEGCKAGSCKREDSARYNRSLFGRR
ncbi:hypothetical protein TWF281_006157 [Arthrobotrys megalospora]